MLLVELDAIRDKIDSAGGDFETDIIRVISDNSLYDMPEKSEIIWDDDEEIVIVKELRPDNRFGPDAMKTAPRWTVVFFAYAQIQRLQFKFPEDIKDALA